MQNRLPFFSGVALATIGVSGLAGGGLLWHFQGRTLGLGSTLTSLVLLGVSFALLRPEPQSASIEFIEDSTPLRVKAPQASLLGLMLALIGTLGMAASGLLWNFQGLSFGLSGTLTATVALLLSFVFLWPLGGVKLSKQQDIVVTDNSQLNDEIVTNEPSTTQTTSEAIAQALAIEEQQRPARALVNFAPLHLLPGQVLPTRARRGGKALGRYRSMANDLFRN